MRSAAPYHRHARPPLRLLGDPIAPDGLLNQTVENMEVLVSTFSQNVHAIISASFGVA